MIIRIATSTNLEHFVFNRSLVDVSGWWPDASGIYRRRRNSNGIILFPPITVCHFFTLVVVACKSSTPSFKYCKNILQKHAKTLT